MSEILAYLNNHQKKIEETLVDLVKAESPSQNKKLADRCGEVLSQTFEYLVGGTIEVIEKEKVGNQYRFTYGHGNETEQILIIGHYDTVWDEGVLPIRKENGALYGPGTFDMKGGLTITLWALKALKNLNHFAKRKVVFLVTSDEEIGSAYSRELIEEEARKSAIVFVPESSISNTGAVKTSRKGIGIFKLIVHGKSVHAGINPWDGASAIDELAHQISDIKKLDDREKGISINIGTIMGGSRTNVVANYAEADIDFRFQKKEHGDALEESLLKRPCFVNGTSVEVKGGINRYPMEESEAVLKLYDQLKEIAAEFEYPIQRGSSGGASDGNLAAGIGIPTIDGLGPLGDGAHAENEHVILRDLPYRAALLAELIKRSMD